MVAAGLHFGGYVAEDGVQVEILEGPRPRTLEGTWPEIARTGDQRRPKKLGQACVAARRANVRI